MANLAKVFAKRGIKMSTQKTKLWSSPEMILEDHSKFEMRISDEYDESAFIIVRDGEQSRLIPFAKDEIDIDDYVANDDGIVEKPGFTVNIGIVSALRDDSDLKVRDLEGDLVTVEEDTQTLKCYVS